MATYIVIRGGSSNTHNSEGVCGTVDARGVKAAEKEAYETFTCYNGQYLEVKLASRCGWQTNVDAAEADARRAEEDSYHQSLIVEATDADYAEVR